MNDQVMTLTLDHTVKACFEYMEKHRVRNVPVVDKGSGREKPQFIGIISDRDVLRQIPPGGIDKKVRDEQDKKALRQLLVQLVERDPKSVSPDSLISEALTIMLNNHVDGVPVLKDGDLAGMITTTAMLRIFSRLETSIHSLFPELEKAKQLSDVSEGAGQEEMMLKRWVFKPVKEIMTHGVMCLSRKDTLEKAMKTLQEGEFRHAPVVSEEGELEGLISDRDILRYLPNAGRRPPRPDKVFRGYLFSVKTGCSTLQMPVEEFMIRGRKVKTVSPETTTIEAAMMMRKKKISSLPVIDGEGKLLGLVTVANLLCELLGLYEVPHYSAERQQESAVT
jgi:acetoin utilization protein AcuB